MNWYGRMEIPFLHFWLKELIWMGRIMPAQIVWNLAGKIQTQELMWNGKLSLQFRQVSIMPGN